jgi:hypothetical protein
MGLTVAVGLYAQNLAEEGEKFLDEPFIHLNEVLVEKGMAPHAEPRTIPNDEYFEAGMWGYGGLHALRRVAAYLTLKGKLPPPVEYSKYTEDPVYLEFNEIHDGFIRNPLSTGFFGMFRKLLPAPPFQHLVMHSDAEGFYTPQAFDLVIADWTQPERPGLGMMIGSSVKLLEECEALAKSLNLPSNFDPESDEFLAFIESPPRIGEPWQILAVEAHTVANLANAARASLKLGAVIQFC